MIKKQNLINLNLWISRLILKKGKLSKASLIMDRIHFLLVKAVNEDSFIVLNQAIKNIKPFFLLKNKKIGKRIIISPFFILSDLSRQLIAIKWLIDSALKRKGDFAENFVLEVLDAFNNKGSVKKKQVDLTLLVLKNKSNLKYRW